MALMAGEMYRCEHCQCSIEVTKSANPAFAGDLDPRCCCGEQMKRLMQ